MRLELIVPKLAENDKRYHIDVLKDIDLSQELDIFNLMFRSLMRLPKTEGAKFKADKAALSLMQRQKSDFDFLFRGCPIELENQS